MQLNKQKLITGQLDMSDLTTRNVVEPNDFLTFTEIVTLRELVRSLDGKLQMLRDSTVEETPLIEHLQTEDQIRVVKRLLSFHGERANNSRKRAA